MNQQKESQNRLDSIIALIMEEAQTVQDATQYSAIYQVLMKVTQRVMEIIRTKEE